jgi:biotin synthase
MTQLRNDWQLAEIEQVFQLPFNDLVFKAATIHRENFNPNQVQVSAIINFKTGACPEDCKYCTQSAHYKTPLQKEPMMQIFAIIEEAKKAKEAGASRYCMAAGWRGLHDRDLPEMVELVKEVKSLGLETCMSLGLLKEHQANSLKEAGLDYYNHNIDTSPENYANIITTRTFQDRLDTLEHVRKAGINVCSGGILGLGENIQDRASMLQTLANLKQHPKSVPLNLLIAMPGTPFEDQPQMDIFDFIRTVAVARIIMPKSFVRITAGRINMSEEAQSLCFLAGANSIHYGEKLLTAPNPSQNKDVALFNKLGIEPLEV